MADSTPATRSCPVCFEAFSLTQESEFALHVASCSRSSLSPCGSPLSSTVHCPLCLHVYTAETLAHEISFHEHECARVNAVPHDQSDDESSSSILNCTNKRQRHDAVAPSAPSVTLFPSTCFLCGNSGRGLLHCMGRCARAAHLKCVDQLQALCTRAPQSVVERRQAADTWKCAQCVRGLHGCHHCGFLGHDASSMRKCTVVDCGNYFHVHCLPEATTTGFVCSRHTCKTCGTKEIDMKRCTSCSLCDYMTHLRCPKGSHVPATGSTGLAPSHLFQCPRHDTEPRTTLLTSSDASNSLKQRLAAGDVVLVLEFNNALLPSSAKEAAPDAANHWGIVVSVDETEPSGPGNQLLSVRMFADDMVLEVPTEYALRVATAIDFSQPVDLICHCLQRHAMVELQLRQLQGNLDAAEEKRILSVTRAAFAGRLKALGITEAQATSNTEQGLARWRRFQELPQPRQYDGLGDSAPSYLFIDTRGRHCGQQTASSVQSPEAATADADGDVSMTDPDKGESATTGIDVSTLTPLADAGKSSQANEGDGANSSLRTNTQDTIITGTQDTQQGGDSWSQDTSTSIAGSTVSTTRNNQASDCDVKRKTRTANCIGRTDAKRQKTNSETLVGLNVPVYTPTDVRGLQAGATLSSASTHATLHMSPTASRAIFPQKRKQMTRRQNLLADMPPLLLKELERQVYHYLEDADGAKPKPTRLPADADAFPWAARAASSRPAFYGPTVMLGHSGLHRPGVDAVSRLLVSQDKRSIKCFVQATADDAEMTRCSHVTTRKASCVSPGYVLLDLMSLHSFRDLEMVVRTRLVEALEKNARYTRHHFGMDSQEAQRWLEQQRRRKINEQPPISLTYCAMDGVRYHLELKQSSLKPSFKDKQAWVCFCANARHLAVAIAVPSLSRGASLPIASAVQHVPGTAK